MGINENTLYIILTVCTVGFATVCSVIMYALQTRKVKTYKPRKYKSKLYAPDYMKKNKKNNTGEIVSSLLKRKYGSMR